MKVNDQYIKDNFVESNGIINRNKFNNSSNDIINYVKNRFKDSESIKESLYRIINNIEIRPVCPICGGYLHFNGRKKSIYTAGCCKEHSKLVSIKHFKETLQNKSDEEIIASHLITASKIKAKSQEEKELIKRKKKLTKLKHYGDPNFINIEKRKETLNNKYGVNSAAELPTNNFKVNNPQKNQEIKEKTKLTNNKRYNGNSPTCDKTVREKQYESHFKNDSFRKSKAEDSFYNKLKLIYPNTIRNYKSSLYPYCCDFYIPSVDLYIELNYSWTHGFHWFDENSEEDINKLNLWKSKHTKYYDNAIDTWTRRDKEKLKCAKDNSLNYLVFWNVKEGVNWLNSLKLNF